MQVFGLPRHVIRAGAVASRIAAQLSRSEAAIRRDVLARWMDLRGHGLSARQAARGVGHSRSTLYRWLEEAEPKRRRPHRVRAEDLDARGRPGRPRKTWTPELVEAVERIWDDNPMWGKGKIVILLAREGVKTSASTVERILRSLAQRGVVIPVPTLRRRPGPRRLRLTMKDRHARRLPKGLKPTAPGELVQIDTLFVNVRPDKPVKQITAYDRSPSGWWDGSRSPPPPAPPPPSSTSSRSTSTPSPTASITTNPTRPSADEPQQNTSNPSAPETPPRPICAEPGQGDAVTGGGARPHMRRRCRTR